MASASEMLSQLDPLINLSTSQASTSWTVSRDWRLMLWGLEPTLSGSRVTCFTMELIFWTTLPMVFLQSEAVNNWDFLLRPALNSTFSTPSEDQVWDHHTTDQATILPATTTMSTTTTLMMSSPSTTRDPSTTTEILTWLLVTEEIPEQWVLSCWDKRRCWCRSRSCLVWGQVWEWRMLTMEDPGSDSARRGSLSWLVISSLVMRWFLMSLKLLLSIHWSWPTGDEFSY